MGTLWNRQRDRSKWRAQFILAATQENTARCAREFAPRATRRIEGGSMKSQDNDLLTQVGPDTPMGQMLRQYWTPAIRSAALEADGAPVRVRLFGQDFVAFRDTSGRPGFVDEACPHRGVSLALARNEDNGLRCIFHGWKFDTTGKVIDAPAEPAERREKFCADRKSTRLNSSHSQQSRMPSSA